MAFSHEIPQLGVLLQPVAAHTDVTAPTQVGDLIVYMLVSDGNLYSKDHSNTHVQLTGISGGGTLDSVVAGDNIHVDATDPANPIIALLMTGALAMGNQAIENVYGLQFAYNSGTSFGTLNVHTDGTLHIVTDDIADINLSAPIGSRVLVVGPASPQSIASGSDVPINLDGTAQGGLAGLFDFTTPTQAAATVALDLLVKAQLSVSSALSGANYDFWIAKNGTKISHFLLTYTNGSSGTIFNEDVSVQVPEVFVHLDPTDYLEILFNASSSISVFSDTYSGGSHAITNLIATQVS